ncbi:hypothetical protein GCM10009760_43910 [Kitasatospora kazusensis]|uniref:LamG-like jellyroll fold domain-containing protein n=1 Tax=Kitasatospora kazusensis TaxID=407974 RepID=A0ABN2ZZ34_9ACTN
MSDGGGIPGQSGADPGWNGPQQRPAYVPPAPAEPDWEALAQRNQQEDRRRTRLKIGGAALGVLLVGGMVAGALVLQQPGGSGPAASAHAAPASGTAAGTPLADPGSPSASPDASARTVKVDDRGGHHPLSLSHGAVLGPTEGHNGQTLVLNSSPEAYAQTNTVVVNTAKSFTVSALVRNNAPTGGRSAVSQGSDSYYSFDLGRDYWAGHNQWVFKVQTAAGGQDDTTYQAFSKTPATTGQWTLLTGVYDVAAKKISLYVDGRLAQTTAVKGVWHTSGPLQLGRVRYKSAWSDSWDGAITDVQAWDQALPAARIAQLAAGGSGGGGAAADAPPMAGWLLP